MDKQMNDDPVAASPHAHGAAGWPDGANPRSNRASAFATALLTGVALVALAAPSAQAAQAVAEEAEVEELVVTGTNIHGVAQVGQALTQLDRTVIESTAATTVQQLLSTASPQLNSFGSAGQNQAGTGASFQPNIRSLGGLSSGSTLVLVDGHRIAPGGGLAGSTGDPNIVPAGAVERVEILADGASAIYGSDAVAGVINIITRKNYNGYEVSGQVSFADQYRTYTGNLVYGHSWDTGSVLATYGYTSQSNLPGTAGPPTVTGNQSNSGPGATGRGGNNFRNFTCAPATFVPNPGQPGAGRVFQSPYATGSGVVNNALLNGVCTTINIEDLLPQTEAHRLYMAVRQNLGDRVKLSASIQYSKTLQVTKGSRGGVTTVQVYGPGSAPPSGAGQINPFFQGPPGVNRGTISFNFDELFGPGQQTRATNEVFMATGNVDVDLGYEWLASFGIMAGLPQFHSEAIGGICQPCAFQALNGTSFANGNAAQNALSSGALLGTNVAVTRLPLTAANALDVWNTGAANRTSALVREQLTNNETFNYSSRPVADFLLKFDGPLFAVPAGKVRMAFGGEYYSAGLKERNTTTNAISNTAQTATFTYRDYDSRHVKSVFAQFNVPVVSDAMEIPFIQELNLDVSARYDYYNDLIEGNRSTKNPRFGATWVVGGGLQVRGSYGTSFTAPRHGQNQPQANTVSEATGQFIVPAGYPGATSIPGCVANAPCTINAATGQTGITIGTGGSRFLRPMTGRTWSFGFDYRPTSGPLEGLRLSVTNWAAVFRNVITNQTNSSLVATTPGLGDLLILNPTAQQLADKTAGLRQTTPLPANIYYIRDTSNLNLFHFRGKGVDIDANYSRPTDIGTFSVGANFTYKYDWSKQIGMGDVLVIDNVGNASNTMSPLKLLGRVSAGYRSGPVRIDLFMNYIGHFYYQDSNVQYLNSPCPKGVNPPRNDLGCQRVGSSTTFDAHVSYDFQGDSFWLDGLQIYGDVRNIMDKTPPWTNGPNGFQTAQATGNSWSDPRGRVISVGVRKRW